MEIYKRGPFVTFQGIATFQSQCSWWKEKELSFIPSCWHVSYLPFFFFLTCLFKHQKSPHIPQILSYPRNKNEFKGGGGGWKLCPAQDPPGHRPWSPQSRGSGTLSHRWEQGGYQITQESPWPQNSTPTPISVQEERRGKGFHIVLAFLPFDMVLSHVSCAITKYKGGIKKQVPAAASINW